MRKRGRTRSSRSSRKNPRRVDVAARAEWAKPLADVIARALSIDPSARYATPAEFSAALSAAAPGKIASRATVSQWVARVFGERIEARLVKYEPKVDVTFGSVGAPPMSVPPLAVAPPAAAKVPEIEAPKIEAPKVESPKVEAKAEPKIEAPAKIEAPKIDPPKVEAPKGDVAKVEPKKAEPAKEKSLAASPVRKAMASTPEVAKKAVPLPKRAGTDPDSSPSLVAAAKAAKTNGTTPAAKTKADKVVAANVPPPKPPAAPAPEFEDIDMVSVRPPPMAKKEPEPSPSPPAMLSPSPTPSPSPSPSPSPTPSPSPSPSPSPTLSPSPPPTPTPSPIPGPFGSANVIVAPDSEPEIPRPPPAARISARDSEINVYAKRSPYRGPLLVFVGIALAAGGFAAGRYTAPDAWPPPPTFSATTSAAPPPPPTQTATATVTTTATTASAAPTTTKTDARALFAPSAATDAGAREGGARYDPHGI